MRLLRFFSSDFVFNVIHGFGGRELFYRKFYVTAVSPIGFIKDGKNINYYDDKKLCEVLNEYIVQSLKYHIRFGIDRSESFCLGEGENFKFLKKLNEEHHFFDRIVPLAHPRYIMQYKRKMRVYYVHRYLKALNGNIPEK